jgi:NhaD family Na+/H+ antiporter
MAILIIITFILGYLFIAFEHSVRINKAASALITGVICWTIYIISAPDFHSVTHQLAEHLGELSQILFFLMGAMAIVELIDAHEGFEIITKRITTLKKSRLIWIIGVISFFLSAVLDNLTTTIVMVSLVRKLVADKTDRWMLAGLIVIAANAGGAWSPIGDVTTTMLWIGGQITAGNIILKLFLPSIVCLLVPMIFMRFVFKGNIQSPLLEEKNESKTSSTHRNIVFFSGVGVLLMVPVFKSITHLPPFMGILLGLGILWVITEFIHSGRDEEDRKKYSVAYALQRIDTPSILFFLGILLAIAALGSTGQLLHAAEWLSSTIKNETAIGLTIGALSAIVDNVPLVAATQGMYDLQTYPIDHYFWELLAYATGTGGSMLIIGSAAGVAAMGLEKINFIWYLKKIGWLALLGYILGAATYVLQATLFA